MTLEDAINTSQVHAARGYNEEDECVVSVAYYGGELLWLTGFGGNWAKKWEKVPEEERSNLDRLNFRPTGPKPEDQIEKEVIDALTEIYEMDDEKDNMFDPIGELD